MGSAVKILSIDGGGMRGYIAALVLAELEKAVAPRFSTIAEAFDLIGGTSTGALIALALSAPEEEGPKDAGRNGGGFWSRLFSPSFVRAKRRFSASDLARFYEAHGAEIFPKAHAFAVLKQAFGAKYDPAPLERVLLETFGSLKLSDALNPVVVPAYDVAATEALVMKHPGGECDYYMRDAARGSAAAPTYFPPARVVPVGGNSKNRVLVDGGLAANNPALCCAVEAMRLFPRKRRIVVVSIGTGNCDSPYNAEAVPSWSSVDWIDPRKGVPLYGMMSEAQSSVADYQLRHLPMVEYLRLAPPYPVKDVPIDSAEDATFSRMSEVAADILARNRDVVSRILALL